MARRYHVDRTDLPTVNGTSYPVTMTAGKAIATPEKTYEGNARVAQSAEHEPIRVQYGSRAVRSLAANPPSAGLTASLTSSASAP